VPLYKFVTGRVYSASQDSSAGLKRKRKEQKAVKRKKEKEAEADLWGMGTIASHKSVEKF